MTFAQLIGMARKSKTLLAMAARIVANNRLRLSTREDYDAFAARVARLGAQPHQTTAIYLSTLIVALARGI